ncbi:helix-turn-helix transcriptional regulator [Streptomyces longispororuber]|uniref:helix-turn-helix transcriptional regulator n=1 Tax=Streptomyces longispororuber TaxID=68230 RepID=UPI0021089EA9|nr:helix-turn-helix transcriptional regulator [Streptomyces longispororuber]MCQ4207668.1 helix-turn-helix transcriptional regulator [Streptomyces longispororuber]
MRWVARQVGDAAERSKDLVSLWSEVTDALCAVVPDVWDTCWYTVDPASLLVTSHFRRGRADVPEELLEELMIHEHYGDDVNRIADLCRTATGMGGIHEATGGDVRASTRWRRSLEVGSDQELRVSLRTGPDETWGALSLYREAGRPPFDADAHAVLRRIAPVVAHAVRRMLLPSAPGAGSGAARAVNHGPDEGGPGLVLLDRDFTVRSASPGTERRLRRLPGHDHGAAGLPVAVVAVAAATLRAVDRGGYAARAPFARVVAADGGRLALYGTHVPGPGSGDGIAVIIEQASPGRMLPLLLSAYELTDRERDVVRLILRGRSTAQIATGLSVTPHTVQQHLKSVFAKTGVRSRRDLVGILLSEPY